ncbi:hypothetical protein [Caulobacter zeae]|uniref:hypothetical protein n=1 Tax=Caulobacter zeae TaxID=2055137 RepID=UPI00196B47E6|nr:hypothetical protein [Caulobacter zeae]
MLGALGRILKAHWAGLLAVLVALALGRTGLEQLFDLAPRGFHADEVIWPTATSFMRVALTALLTSAFLRCVLVGVRNWKTSTRAALTSFPAVYGVLLLVTLPNMVGEALSTAAVAMSVAADAPMQDVAWIKLKIGLTASLVSLSLYALISPGVAIAVKETPSLATALASALRLTRKRRFRIVLIEFTSIVLTAVILAAAMSLPLLTLEAPRALNIIPLIRAVLDSLFIGLEMLMMAAIYQELRRTRPLQATA